MDGDPQIGRFEYVMQCLDSGKAVEFEAVRREDCGIEAGTLEDELIDEEMVGGRLCLTLSSSNW